MRNLLYLTLFMLIFRRETTRAQTIQTVIGCGIGDDSTATRAELYYPIAVVTDIAGNIYVGEGGNNRIRKVNNSGVVTTVAGTGIPGNSGDGGAAIMANIGPYSGMGMDKDGNVCFANTFYNCIRKLNLSTGIISTVVGNDTAGYSGTGGPATAARIGNVMGIAFDKIGNMYIAEELSNCIRKIDTFGIITLVGGTPPFGFGYFGDGGPATAASLNGPEGVFVDDTGNVYIADAYNNCVRKINTAGVIYTLAGNGTMGSTGDGGPAAAALLSNPTAVVVDSIGSIYILDAGNNKIRKIDAAGNISTYAGTGANGFSGDGGVASGATFNGLNALWLDKLGNLLVSDGANNRIRKINAGGIISTVVGESGSVTDGGPAIAAEILSPGISAIDHAGNIYIPDVGNNRIKKIDRSGSTIGNITTVVGNGIFGFSGDGGPAIDAELRQPASVSFDTAGNMLIADQGNNRIRKVSTAGVITTIAGNGNPGYGGDGGPADLAQLYLPWGAAADNTGNIYIADYGNNRVRKVNAAGVITTIAGTGVNGYSGDGGPADTAEIVPNDVVIDASGNLIIADWGNSRIRKIDLVTGIISTIAGTGTAGYSGDGGAAVAAELNYPWSIKLDDSGNLFIVDIGNDRIRKVNTLGVISTVAGKTGSGFIGDGGPADSALFNNIEGLCIDNGNNLFISDAGNNRVREVIYNVSTAAIHKTATVINLFPNPANNTITVSVAPFVPKLEGTVLNILGQEVKRVNMVNNPQIIDIDDLVSGVYMFQLIDNNTAQKTTVRFVKG